MNKVFWNDFGVNHGVKFVSDCLWIIYRTTDLLYTVANQLYIIFRAVTNGYLSIKSGENDVIVAGGQESMSLAPHAVHLRNGIKMGDGSMIDTMISDGLTDAFGDIHMGITGINFIFWSNLRFLLPGIEGAGWNIEPELKKKEATTVYPWSIQPFTFNLNTVYLFALLYLRQLRI